MPPEGIVMPSFKDLPCEDGAMENTFDHAQSSLLKEPLLTILHKLHPDGRFCVVHDTGFFYWHDETRRSMAVVPDWAYVPWLPMLKNGEPRRSFISWAEPFCPVVVLEYVSDTDGGERDRTPEEGKFWIYEKFIRPLNYGIYDVLQEQLEMYRWMPTGFEPMAANDKGRFFVPQLGLALGVWHGSFQGVTLPWLRWFDAGGILLPTDAEMAEREHERADHERQRADHERTRAEQERARADHERMLKEKYAAMLRKLGADPDQV